MIFDRSFISGLHTRRVEMVAIARSDATSKAYAVFDNATKISESRQVPSPVQFDVMG